MDPYDLRSRKRGDMEGLNKNVKKFYRKQNTLIEAFLSQEGRKEMRGASWRFVLINR